MSRSVSLLESDTPVQTTSVDFLACVQKAIRAAYSKQSTVAIEVGLTDSAFTKWLKTLDRLSRCSPDFFQELTTALGEATGMEVLPTQDQIERAILEAQEANARALRVLSIRRQRRRTDR